MAHEVESMFSAREVPWHGLGTIVDKTLTAKEALVLAGLDWEVQLAPLFAKPEQQQQLVMPGGLYDPTDPETDSMEPVKRYVPYTGEPILVDGQFAVLRDSDLAIMGVVGSQYQPIQNWKAFELTDSLVGGGSAHYETAGSLRGGRQIFMSMKVPKDILIGGVDSIDLYVVLVTSHDGSRAFTWAITPIRPVCMNTVNWGLSRAKQQWSIRHTESAEGKIEEARKALDLTFAYADEFQAEADRMIQTEFTKAEFQKLVETIVPSKGDDSAAMTQKALIGTLESSTTIDDAFRYTQWGAINAVAEYYDWIRPMRESKSVSVAEKRTTGALFGDGKKQKEAAFKILTAV